MRRTTERLGLVARVALVLALSPLFFVYGLITLARVPGAVRRRFRATAAGLSRTLTCSRGHENPAAGRFQCARCKGVYHGWVGRCSMCGAGAGFVACARCGLSIPLPWRGL